MARWQAHTGGPPTPSIRLPHFGARNSRAGAGARILAILLKVARAREGERNQLTFWAARAVRDMVLEGAIDHVAALDALGQLRQAAAYTGLRPLEIERTIGSSLRRSA